VALVSDNMPGIFRAKRRGKSSELEESLKRATTSRSLQISESSLSALVEASRGIEGRRELMRYLHECLRNPASRRWRRLYAAIVVLEELLRRGHPDLVQELASGYHFDLAQRCCLLQAYHVGYDVQVEGLVRSKAQALHSLWKDMSASLEGSTFTGESVASCRERLPKAMSFSAAHADADWATCGPLSDMLEHDGEVLERDDSMLEHDDSTTTEGALSDILSFSPRVLPNEVSLDSVGSLGLDGTDASGYKCPPDQAWGRTPAAASPDLLTGSLAESMVTGNFTDLGSTTTYSAGPCEDPCMPFPVDWPPVSPESLA